MYPNRIRTLLSGAATLTAAAALLPFSLPTSAFAQAPTDATAPPAAPDTALALLGKPAPAFTLPDQTDKNHSLADSHGKWTVLAFYPKDMSKGCTFQNISYSRNIDKFGPLNAVVYTVSTQDTASKKQFCSLDNLHHTLLSDVGGKTAQAYGVLKGANARRVTFYISPDGIVADVDTKIKTTTAGEDSIAKLTHLEAPKSAVILKSRKVLLSRGDAAQGHIALAAYDPAEFRGPASVRVRIDKAVPDFSLVDPATGKIAAFSTLSAGKKATVLIFVSTHCPVSNAYNDRMEQIETAYSSKGVQVIGINANVTESPEDVVAHAKQHGLTFAILKDTNDKVADQFNAGVTPEAYVVDAKGILVYHGSIDDSQDPAGVTKHYLAAALDEVLADKPVTVKIRRAFGCSIKRGDPGQ